MRRFILSILFVGLFGLVVSSSYIYAQDDEEQPTTDYIGSRRCFGCHRNVGPSHFESRHALTLQDTSDDSEPILADFEQGEDIRSIQLPGEESARPFTPEDVAFAIGTGRYAQLYVARVELDGAETYMVLPAEWNVIEQVWQPYTPAEAEWPSEAYNFVQNCAGCHVTGLNAGEDDPWLEAGVQCESCHGPGADHFEAVQEAGGSPEPEELDQLREAIVLSPDSQICGQCHSQGATPDGLPYPVDYLPGENLLDEGVFALHPPDDTTHWWATGHASRKYMQFNEEFYFGHSGSLASLRESEGAEDACLTCHSEDYRWTVDLLEAHESAEREGTPPDAVTVDSAQFGVTCVSCHTIHSEQAEDEESDEAAPAHDFLIEQATYELCVSCHQDTDITESMHHPIQEMYEGQDVIEEVTGVPSAHFVAEDGPECATCHMPRVPTDMTSRTSHTFQPVMPGATLDLEALQDSCSVCHGDQVDAAGLQALIDDIQGDTQARLDTIRAALSDDTPDWVRIGLDFVEGDGSLGVHNYVYTDDVLDAIEAELGLTAQEGNISEGAP